MKINFVLSNNKTHQQNVSFGAGLTPQMAEAIRNTDICEISKKLANEGIENDFKDNKVVAWCCDKTVEIFKQLNERYNLKLALPKGVFLEDFENLNIDNANSCIYGFCNLLPTKLKKNSTLAIPEKTIFFNSFSASKEIIKDEIGCNSLWGNIDKISDNRFLDKNSSTDNFLDIFLHEFVHSSHEDKLLKQNNVVKKLKSMGDENYLKDFQQKYGQTLSQICEYASTSPMEATACDMSRRIADCLDPQTLSPTNNPFINSPYEKLSIKQKIMYSNLSKKEDLSLEELLRNFWNCRFE